MLGKKDIPSNLYLSFVMDRFFRSDLNLNQHCSTKTLNWTDKKKEYNKITLIKIKAFDITICRYYILVLYYLKEKSSRITEGISQILYTLNILYSGSLSTEQRVSQNAVINP